MDRASVMTFTSGDIPQGLLRGCKPFQKLPPREKLLIAYRHLIKKGHNVVASGEAENQILLRDIVPYHPTVRRHSDPDFGVREEGPEAHSSSIGSVLAGFTMRHHDGHYHHKYKSPVPLYQHMPVPLVWAQSFYIVARQSLAKAHEIMGRG